MEKIYVDFREKIETQIGLDAIIRQLQKLKTTYTKKGCIALDLGWNEYYMYVHGKRLETDVEFEKRMASMELEKLKEENEKEKRRLEYLKLKKEFE